MSKIIPGGRIGRSSIVLAGLGAAFVLAAPASALAQGMLCPVSFNVTSATTLGALQINAGYASAAALGDIVECTVLPLGADDVLYNPAGNSTTIGYADTVGFTGPTTFASCVFKTVGETGPVAGDFNIAIVDATDNDVPPNDVTPTIAAVVGACVPSGSCSYTPETGCKLPTVAAKSKMSFKNNADDTKDQGQFQWKSGAETLVTEFSDPTTTGETWSWCTYDNGVLVRGSDVASGAVGWAASGTTGFQFKGDVEGVAQIKVKAGEAGKASVSVKAKSKLGNFVSPTLPLTGPTVAQLVIDNGVTTTCFQSTAGIPSKNDAASFSAKGNP
jgi:hypothetical protein